jgi:hypothetical protein
MTITSSQTTITTLSTQEEWQKGKSPKASRIFIINAAICQEAKLIN